MDLKRAEKAVRELLEAMGEDPDREGLETTPSRVARAWEELSSGYALNPEKVLKTSDGKEGFTADYDQMVVASGIRFWSTCEHHMMPFGGTVDIGYIPKGKVVGLSKLPRLVEVYARRLQIQEQMTSQIAHALNNALGPLGVGVRVKGAHLCASCRGVRKDVTMTTSVLLGRFRAPEVRNEFWSLAQPITS